MYELNLIDYVGVYYLIVCALIILILKGWY